MDRFLKPFFTFHIKASDNSSEILRRYHFLILLLVPILEEVTHKTQPFVAYNSVFVEVGPPRGVLDP